MAPGTPSLRLTVIRELEEMLDDAIRTGMLSLNMVRWGFCNSQDREELVSISDTTISNAIKHSIF